MFKTAGCILTCFFLNLRHSGELRSYENPFIPNSVFRPFQAFIAKLEAEKAEIANIVNKTRDELTAAKETAHTLQRQAIDVSQPSSLE